MLSPYCRRLAPPKRQVQIRGQDERRDEDRGGGMSTKLRRIKHAQAQGAAAGEEDVGRRGVGIGANQFEHDVQVRQVHRDHDQRKRPMLLHRQQAERKEQHGQYEELDQIREEGFDAVDVLPRHGAGHGQAPFAPEQGLVVNRQEEPIGHGNGDRPDDEVSERQPPRPRGDRIKQEREEAQRRNQEADDGT